MFLFGPTLGQCIQRAWLLMNWIYVPTDLNCYARLITEEKTTLSFSVPVRQCLSLYLKNSKNKNSLNSVSQLIFTFYLSDFPQNKHKVLNGVLQLRPYTQAVHTT